MIRFNLQLTLLIGLSFLVQSFTCSGQMQESKSSAITEKTLSKASYRYADGSGNVFRIFRDSEPGSPVTFSYAPVKPEFSSSGTYDGGDAVKKEMTSEEFQEIQELFEKCLESSKGALEKRTMGSGQVSANIDGSSRWIILARGDARNTALFSWLSDFRVE